MMLRDAEKTVTIVTTADGLNRKFEALMPALEKCKKRGVKIRIAAPLTKETADAVKDISGVAEIRNTVTSAISLFIARIIQGQIYLSSVIGYIGKIAILPYIRT